MSQQTMHLKKKRQLTEQRLLWKAIVNMKLLGVIVLLSFFTGCVTHYRALEIETRILVLESKLDQLKKDVAQQDEA